MNQFLGPVENNKWFTIGIALSLSAATFARPLNLDGEEPWRDEENPMYLVGSTVDSRLFPEDGSKYYEVTKKPWSGSWYPTVAGGIAVRFSEEILYSADPIFPMKKGKKGKKGSAESWQSYFIGMNGGENFDEYHLYTEAELVEKGALWIRSHLSAIEKLDVAMGNARDASSPDFYRNTKRAREWANWKIHSRPYDMDFHGICDGFSNAAINLPEPSPYQKSIQALSADGTFVNLPIVFGSGDLKGLASFYYDRVVMDENRDPSLIRMLSQDDSKCNEHTGSGCKGLNAGTFHLLLQNLVKGQGLSFVVDIDHLFEVWNFPVVGYRSWISEPYVVGSGSSAFNQVEVYTDVTYMGESFPRDAALLEANDNGLFTKRYHYVLTIGAPNAQGVRAITGGSWVGRDRPDFAWRMKHPAYRGDFRLLDQIWVDAATVK